MKTEQGLWRLSPSGLYKYTECHSCFWIENHIGRAPHIPPRLNSALDVKLKERFDSFRKLNELPPEITSSLKGFHLFKDQTQLNIWRTRGGLKFTNDKDGYLLTGALDEVLISPDKKLVSSDYKSSGDSPKPDKDKYYILQIHAYALMLKENGQNIDDKGVLFYYYPKHHRPTPSVFLKLTCQVNKIPLHMRSFRDDLRDMVILLEKPYPGHNPTCEDCQYRKSTLLIKGFVSQKHV